MKIIYLVNNIDPKNGWGRLTAELIEGAKQAGHETLILKEVNDGYGGIVAIKRSFGIFLSAWRVRKYAKEVDIIHAIDGYPYGIIGSLAGLGLKIRLIITAVGTYSVAPLHGWKWAFLLRWAYRRADLVTAISNYTKEAIMDKAALPKISIINPGIDLIKFNKPHQFQNEKFILSVGALKFRKGYHVSIPAFALFSKKFPDFSYVIVGSQTDVGYFNNLKNIVNSLGINSKVKFLSGISERDLPDIYSKASVFILTSVNENYNFEGFGLVFLEAAAAGLPVIGTTGNGIEDAVKNGFNGILVPQNNIQKTAEALINIISNKETAKKFSQNSYDWANQHSLKKMTSEYAEFYKGILNKKF